MFLDANISPWIAEYLSDVKHCAHWICFGDVPHFRKKNISCHPERTRSRWRKLRKFYDLTGNWDLGGEGEPQPFKRKDYKIMSYIMRLIRERYPERRVYVFYTCDKHFFTREKNIQNHPDLEHFKKGRVATVFLENLRGNAGLEQNAMTIRTDLLQRLAKYKYP